MIELVRQKDFRPLQKLPFCYFCGLEFAEGDKGRGKLDDDHVPPETIFEKSDRDPLKLRTHVACNDAHEIDDETIGQLIALGRGYRPTLPRNRKLRFERFPDEGISAVKNIDVEHVVFGWVMGFHAALYREPMPREARASIHTPFQRVHRVGSEVHFEPTIPHYYKIVETVQKNRGEHNVDRICCNKGTMVYECVWSQFSTGEWFCSFMLNIYNWKLLGATSRFGARDCAGVYVYPFPSMQVPAVASKGSSPLSSETLVHGP